MVRMERFCEENSVELQGYVKNLQLKGCYALKCHFSPLGKIDLEEIYKRFTAVDKEGNQVGVYQGDKLAFPAWLADKFKLRTSAKFKLEGVVDPLVAPGTMGGVEYVEAVLEVIPQGEVTPAAQEVVLATSGFAVEKATGHLSNSNPPITRLSPKIAKDITPQELATLRVVDEPRKILDAISDPIKIKQTIELARHMSGKGTLLKHLRNRLKELQG